MEANNGGYKLLRVESIFSPFISKWLFVGVVIWSQPGAVLSLKADAWKTAVIDMNCGGKCVTTQHGERIVWRTKLQY